MSKLPRVETQFFTFATTPEDAFPLENGEKFGPITLAYETFGKLNPARDNAILLFHALSGSQHAAGYNPRVPGTGERWTDECHTGWWSEFIGPGLAFDTDQYFIICANYFGGCYGSTGPSSIDPATGKPYGGSFPVVTVGDVVETQARLVQGLGIERLLAVAGGSLGGVLALEFAMRHPDRTRCVISIASGPRATTLHKLYNFEQICAIEWDPYYNHGNYYDGEPPRRGLALARMISHKTFVHLHLMEARSRDQIIQNDGDLNGYRMLHQIESYMLHSGQKFIERFDANTYLRIVQIWQQFDLSARTGGSLTEALRPCRDAGLRFLLFTIDEDVCFWPEEQIEIAEALKQLGADYSYITIHSEKGHDSFLLEPEKYLPNIMFTLKETYNESRREAAGESIGSGAAALKN